MYEAQNYFIFTLLQFAVICLHVPLSINIRIKIYIIIFPVVLYGCEIWSFTLMQEYQLRAFENKVLRKTFGPWTHEATKYYIRDN
jgi:hypothetical protein